MAFLIVKNLSCSFESEGRELVVLKDVSFSLPKTGAYAILGESGSGKSTLLNCLASFVAYEGEVTYADGQKPSFVFQDSYMIDYLKVLDNVTLPLTLRGASKKERVEEGMKALRQVGLNQFDKPTDQISGGERERVGIARALSSNSQVILMDEPTGSLDSENTSIVANLIRTLKKDHLIIFVTHDLAFANDCSDEILTLKSGRLSNPITSKVTTFKKVKKERTHGLKGGDSLSLSLGMVRKKPLKTIIGVFLIAIAMVFTLFIATVMNNAKATLSEVASLYYGRDITTISEIQTIQVNDTFNLIKTIRPQELNSPFVEEPSLSGILPSSINIRKTNIIESALYSPSVCNENKLKSGRCPLSYEEVVVNESLLSILNEDVVLSSEIKTHIETQIGNIVARDYVSMTLDFKIVGVSLETKMFNIASIYYDYYTMKNYFDSYLLENASKTYGQDVSLLDRVSSMARNDDYLSGYELLLITDYPQNIALYYGENYKVSNRALEMEKATYDLIESMSLIVLLFLVMAIFSSYMLLFTIVLSIYEDNKRNLALINALGLDKGRFSSFSFGTAVLLTFFICLLVVIGYRGILILVSGILSTLQFSSLCLPLPSAIVILFSFVLNLVLSMIVSHLSLSKVIKGDLVAVLKSE